MKQRTRHRFSFIRAGIGLCALFSVAAPGALAGANPSKMEKTPDLTKSCEKLCPYAKTNAQVQKCVKKKEKEMGGDTGLKRSDPVCYAAHEKYEKRTRKQEASNQAQMSEPYRYG